MAFSVNGGIFTQSWIAFPNVTNTDMAFPEKFEIVDNLMKISCHNSSSIFHQMLNRLKTYFQIDQSNVSLFLLSTIH